MVKSCCACGNVFEKGNGIHFYKFPEDPDLRVKWIGAVGRKGWHPTKFTRICSKHFISGEKSTDPLCPDFIPSVFESVSSDQKRKLEESYCRFFFILFYFIFLFIIFFPGMMDCPCLPPPALGVKCWTAG